MACEDFPDYDRCQSGTNIFSAAAGKVVALQQDAVTLQFSVDGEDTTINDLKAIATSVGIQGQGGFQFMHSLREFIYIYVFTERVGEIVINGVAFPDPCTDTFGEGAEVNDGCFQGDTGLERVLRWYECNRITSRAQEIVIAFGPDAVYNAFLVGVKADIADASTGIAQFTFRFNYIPNISDTDDFCFPFDDSCLTDSPCG